MKRNPETPSGERFEAGGGVLMVLLTGGYIIVHEPWEVGVDTSICSAAVPAAQNRCSSPTP